jgi:glycosyltransferase involved in cell wall biosynthesis
MKTTLIVATWNEIDGMKAIMPQIDPTWVDQIIIMDGGSTDGTVEWAKEQGYFVYIQKQKGFRHAYCETMPFVTGDVILTFSPDGNSRPQEIPVLVKKMKEGLWDMVIASRYLPPAKSEDDDLLTGFGNWMFTTSINLLLGGNYTDAMGIYRIYKKSLITELGLDKDDAYEIPEKLFRTKVSWEPLLSMRAAKRRLKIAEIPSSEPKRIGGDRKLQIWKWGATFLWQLLATIFWK